MHRGGPSQSVHLPWGQTGEQRGWSNSDKQTSIYPIPSLYPYLDLQVGHFAASVAADFEDLRERYDDSVLGYCDAPVKRNVIHNCLEFKRRRNTPFVFYNESFTQNKNNDHLSLGSQSTVVLWSASALQEIVLLSRSSKSV